MRENFLGGKELSVCSKSHVPLRSIVDPNDCGNARWTGELPVIELHLRPDDYTMYFGHTRVPVYGDCSARLALNDSTIGYFSSLDSLPTFHLPREAMRSDGRQRITLRVSPMDMDRPAGIWLRGLRLDWIYCIPNKTKSL